MNKTEVAKLCKLVDDVDSEFAACTDGERRGELLQLRAELVGRSDVAEALGERAREKQLMHVNAERAGWGKPPLKKLEDAF